MMLSADDAPALPLWINGHAFLTVVEHFYDIVDPATGTILRRTPLCAADSCNEAVSAAVNSLPPWTAAPLTSRLSMLETVADNLERYTEHFTKLIGEETGKDVAAASNEVAAAVAILRQNWTPAATSQSAKVLALLVDDSAPLLGAAALIAPTLAGGNAFVIKPSPKAPSCALGLVELLSRAGIPDGIGNLVHGDDTVIAALSAHNRIPMLAFAGKDSLAVKIAALTERNGKPLFAAPTELASNAWNTRLNT